MTAHRCAYIKTTELYTLNECILWCVNYISIKPLKIEVLKGEKHNKRGSACKDPKLGKDLTSMRNRGKANVRRMYEQGGK